MCNGPSSRHHVVAFYDMHDEGVVYYYPDPSRVHFYKYRRLEAGYTFIHSGGYVLTYLSVKMIMVAILSTV